MSMNSVVQNLKLEQIRVNGGTQPRVNLDDTVVMEYGQALIDGAMLPAVTVFHDGSTYWLADGFHRFFAHRKIGALDIRAEIKTGTQRDAILYSVGANASHGLRRTNEDKRKAIMTLLEDAEWKTWSDNKIAKACGVNQTTVSGYRRSLMENLSERDAQRTYTTKHGTNTVMDTANIGKKAKAPEPTPPEQDASSADEDPFDGVTLEGELHELQQENQNLQVRIKALSSDDTTKALDREIKTRQGIEARLAQEMDRANRLDRELRSYGKFLADLRKTLRIEGGRKEVLSAVSALMQRAA